MRITKKMHEEYAKIKAATKRKVRNTVKKFGTEINDIERHVDPKTKAVTYEVVTKDIRKQLDIPSIESFTSKKAFDEWMYEQRKFTSGRSPHAKFHKNEKGTVYTDYLKLKLENAESKAIKVAEAEKRKVENLPFVKGRGTVGQNQLLMKRPSALGFNPVKLDFNFLWNKADFERKLLGLTVKGTPEDYENKKRQARDNFADIIEKYFNSDGDKIANLIRNLSPQDFHEMYLSYNWDFDYVYEVGENGNLEEFQALLHMLENDLEIYQEDHTHQEYLKPF